MHKLEGCLFCLFSGVNHHCPKKTLPLLKVFLVVRLHLSVLCLSEKEVTYFFENRGYIINELNAFFFFFDK